VTLYASSSVKLLVLRVRAHRNLITNFSKEQDASPFGKPYVLKLEAINFCKMAEIIYQAIPCYNPEKCIVKLCNAAISCFHRSLHNKFEISCYTILSRLPLTPILVLVQDLTIPLAKARQLYHADGRYLPWYTVRSAVLVAREKHTPCNRIQSVKALLSKWIILSYG
jgi:hypothetical protein